MSTDFLIDKHWISVHIFYASNSNPMITDCLIPLVTELRQRSIIKRYFFIKYWLEGPHIRLRLLPADGVSESKVKTEIEPVIEQYLMWRPALYSADVESAQPFYKDMFVAEYSEDAWNQRYGEDGRMLFRPNNSYDYIAYEPEYDRYGGTAGIELAEWHFEKSSDIVARLFRDTNSHVHSILQGLSMQLTIAFCYGFLESETKVIDFLIGYIRYWRESYSILTDAVNNVYDNRYAEMAASIEKRISAIKNSVLQNGHSTRLTNLEQEWLAHIHELRQRVDKLVDEGKLIFGQQSNDNPSFVVEDKLAAYKILLHSYIHMTNNRLGVLFSDEIYLAYLLKRCLEDKQLLIKEVA